MNTTPPRFLLVVASITVWLGCRSGEPDEWKRPARADSARSANSDAIAIINAAIDAFGGESSFGKANVGRTTMEIDGAFEAGIKGRFTKIDSFKLPGQLRRVVQGKSEGQDVNLTYVFNGEEGWMQINNAEPVDIPMSGAITQTYPGDSLMAVLSLRSGHVELAVESQQELDGQPVNCVRITVDGRYTGNTYFHKQTMLPVASKKFFVDPGTGKMQMLETRYSDYKTIDGLRIPMTIETILNGESASKIKVTEVAFTDTVDPGLFAKPVANR
jgi:hypothetical protein